MESQNQANQIKPLCPSNRQLKTYSIFIYLYKPQVLIVHKLSVKLRKKKELKTTYSKQFSKRTRNVFTRPKSAPLLLCLFQACAHCLHKRPAGRAREGVPFHPLPVSTTPHWTRLYSAPDWAADKNLVPESTNENEKGPEEQVVVQVSGWWRTQQQRRGWWSWL